MSLIRIVVADDHVTVREGLVAIIGRQLEMRVVGEAADGEQAVRAWLEHRPDVMLLDLRMPVLDGPAALEEIRAQDPQARVLVLTTFDSDSEISRAVKGGARGYLLKDAPREELLDGIRRVHAGEVYFPSTIVAKLATTISAQRLTRREVDVLTMLSRGTSNKLIGTQLHISETTVKAHLRAIFSKLHVKTRTEAVAAANQRGLIRF